MAGNCWSYVPDDEPQRSAIARPLAERLASVARGEAGLLVSEINGIPAVEHPLAPFLVDAGFYPSAMGLMIRRPSPRPCRDQAVSVAGAPRTQDPPTYGPTAKDPDLGPSTTTMPEGDTIFRAARTLHRALAGKPVLRFESVFPHLTRVHDDEPITGRTVDGVRAAGKHVLMEFSGGLLLRTHMRMNGSWHIYRPGEVWQRPRRSMRIIVGTEDFVAVGFDIPVAEMIKAKDVARHAELRKLGPDLLGEGFDAAEAGRRIRARGVSEIADVLLNQRVLAGIGNVYKSEVLFSCGVSPFAKVDSLTDDEIACLVSTARRFLSANVTDKLAPMTTYTGFRRTTRPVRSSGTSVGLRPRRRSVPEVRDAGEHPPAGARRETHLLVQHMSAVEVLTWIALAVGAAASAAALWGYYGVLPGWLTGPRSASSNTAAARCCSERRERRCSACRMRRWGILLYATLAVGLVAGWPAWLLMIMVIPAVAMSAFLGWSLLVARSPVPHLLGRTLRERHAVVVAGCA